MRIAACCVMTAALAAAGCFAESDPDPVPGLGFAMFSPYDTSPFDAAWAAARADPGAGVAYGFPVVAVDIAAGTEVRLIVGRSTNDPQGPSVTGDDVIVEDPMQVATAWIDDDGRAEFPPLAVVSGAWTSNANTIPADLLCGVTVIAARAYAAGDGEVPVFRLLATTWAVAVTAPCE